MPMHAGNDVDLTLPTFQGAGASLGSGDREATHSAIKSMLDNGDLKD
jgi:hypothetical protein